MFVTTFRNRPTALSSLSSQQAPSDKLGVSNYSTTRQRTADFLIVHRGASCARTVRRRELTNGGSPMLIHYPNGPAVILHINLSSSSQSAEVNDDFDFDVKETVASNFSILDSLCLPYSEQILLATSARHPHQVNNSSANQPASRIISGADSFTSLVAIRAISTSQTLHNIFRPGTTLQLLFWSINIRRLSHQTSPRASLALFLSGNFHIQSAYSGSSSRPETFLDSLVRAPTQ